MDLCVIRTGSLGMLGFCFAHFYKQSLLYDVSWSEKKILSIRAVAGAIGYASLTYAVGNLPLLVWTLLVNTAPFWTAILGFYILKERISTFEFICLFGCFSGVVILAFASSQNEVNLTQQSYVMHPIFGMVCGILNALGYSTVIVVTRKVKHIHFSLVLLSYGIIATTLYTLWVLVEFATDSTWTEVWPRIFYYNRHQWFYLALISIMNAISMTFATLAF